MKTATVRELRNSYASLLKRIEAGEEIKISRRGKIVARLVPEKPDKTAKVDWSKSAAFTMDRSKLPFITQKQKASLFEEFSDKF